MFKNRAFADMYDNAGSCEFESNGDSFVEEEDSEPQIENEFKATDDRDKEDDEVFNEHDHAAEEDDQEVEEASVRSDVNHLQHDAPVAGTHFVDCQAVKDLLLGTKHASENEVEKVAEEVSATVSIQEHRIDLSRSTSAAAGPTISAPMQPKKEAALQDVPPFSAPVLSPQQVASLSAKLHNLRAQVEQEVENEKVNYGPFYSNNSYRRIFGG